MTRKEFFATLAAAVGGVKATSPPSEREVTLEYPWSNAMHPDIPGNSFRKICGRCRVTLNGEDVGNRCWFYDAPQGLVGLYLHKAGGPYLDDSGTDVAKEWRTGKVEVFLTSL